MVAHRHHAGQLIVHMAELIIVTLVHQHSRDGLRLHALDEFPGAVRLQVSNDNSGAISALTAAASPARMVDSKSSSSCKQYSGSTASSAARQCLRMCPPTPCSRRALVERVLYNSMARLGSPNDPGPDANLQVNWSTTRETSAHPQLAMEIDIPGVANSPD